MFNSAALIGEDIVFRHSMYESGKVHSLHTIFKYLAHGYTHKKMREIQKDILPEMIDETRQILVDRNAQFFPDTQDGKALHEYKVLLDENIPPCVAESLRMHFRKVLHVNDVGLAEQKDDKVWQKAIDDRYNIIFTKDRAENTERDLTYMAAMDARSILRAMTEWGGNNFILSDLPMIVHLPGGCDAEAVLKVILRQKKEKFFRFLSNRATPYINILNDEILCGPTYFELRGENYIEDNNISELSSFARRIEPRELFKALWLGRLSPQELRNMTPERENKIDGQIEAYIQREMLRQPSVFRERRLALQAQNLSR